MQNYLDHLKGVGDDHLSFDRKIEYFKYNLQKYIRNTKKDFAVLEIGPGRGAMISFLNKLNIANIDIVDNDKAVNQYISKSFKINKAHLSSDIAKLKSKLQTYDLVLMLQVFEHMPKSQYKTVIKTLYSALKPKGKIIMMVPNGGNPLNMMERYSDLQHENAFTENSLRELPMYCGINSAEILIEPYRIPPVSIVNVLRIMAQQILHFVIRSMLVLNGGVYQRIMTPNITLVISKGK